MCSRHYAPYTGWPPGLLQDDCTHLSKWLAERPGARWVFQRVLEDLGRPVAPSAPP